MSEIKFRAFEDGRMTEPFTLFDIGDDLGRMFIAGFGRVYDPIIMRYTGKKDKNGKEIYEGDIIYSYGRILKTSVSWDDNRAGFFPFINENTNFHAEECEVVGNIYQTRTAEYDVYEICRKLNYPSKRCENNGNCDLCSAILGEAKFNKKALTDWFAFLERFGDRS